MECIFNEMVSGKESLKAVTGIGLAAVRFKTEKPVHHFIVYLSCPCVFHPFTRDPLMAISPGTIRPVPFYINCAVNASS